MMSHAHLHGRFRTCCAQSATMLSVLVLLAAAPLSAQDTPAQRDSVAQQTPCDDATPWVTGVSLGYIRERLSQGQGVTTVGAHFTQMRPGHLGLDFSLGIAPSVLQYGALAMGARGGVTLPLEPWPGLLLLPGFGISAIGGVAPEAIGGVLGYNLGGAAVVGEGALRLRTGITWHQMSGASRGLWLMEIGFVDYAVPRAMPVASATP